MKLVAPLLVALIALPAFAGFVFWQKTFEQYEAARTVEEFRALQQKYPEQFGRVDPNTVESASIQVTRYKLAGDHTCTDADPRANFETKSTSLCTKMNDNGPGVCWAQAVPMPPMYDRNPCAN